MESNGQERLTRATRDQSGTYDVLKTPSDLSLLVSNYSNFQMSDGTIVHHLYVPCLEIKNKLLPMDADPREPSMSPQVKDMRDTLNDHPMDFVKKNNGITLFCDSVDFDSAKSACDIRFGEREGICNGGHTYYAIVGSPNAVPGDATVHLEMIQFRSNWSDRDKLNKIVDISRARNNNVRLAQTSEADYLEYYKPFKDLLPHKEWVVWHEGDSNAVPGAISAADFIRLLTALDPHRFYHPIYNEKGLPHKQAATAIASIHNTWYEETQAYHGNGEKFLPLGHMTVLGNDMFMIRDMISRDLKSKKTDLGRSFRHSSFYKEQIKKGNAMQLLTSDGKGVVIPPTVEVLIVGLFRTDVWWHDKMDGTNPDYIGWFIEPTKLWSRRKTAVMEDLAADYNSFSSDPKEFIRAAAPYRAYFFELGTDQEPPFPEIVINTESGDRFRKVKTIAEATHYFQKDSEQGLLPIGNEKQFEAEVAYYKSE